MKRQTRRGLWSCMTSYKVNIVSNLVTIISHPMMTVEDWMQLSSGDIAHFQIRFYTAVPTLSPDAAPSA
jgi:hypothetical protein